MDQAETDKQTDAEQTVMLPLEPTQDNDTSENIAGPDTAFFPVAEGKLITLYILSFGLYGVYWFYKNWKLQQQYMDKKIYPLLRAIFSIFFTHSLFKRIDRSAIQLEPQHRFKANELATLFVLAIVMSHILDRLSVITELTVALPKNSIIVASLMLFLFSTYPLVKVQATVNRINHDMLGYLNHKYSLANYVLILFGGIFWLLLGLGLLLDSMGLAAT